VVYCVEALLLGFRLRLNNKRQAQKHTERACYAHSRTTGLYHSSEKGVYIFWEGLKF